MGWFFKKLYKIWFWAPWSSATLPTIKSKHDYMYTGFYMLTASYWMYVNRNYEEETQLIISISNVQPGIFQGTGGFLE